MISQSLFLELGFRASVTRDCPDNIRDEMFQFVRPHVLVIHRPSGVGFYLSINMQYIITVNSCKAPENPAKVAHGRFPGGVNPTLGLWLHILPGRTYPANDLSDGIQYQSEGGSHVCKDVRYVGGGFCDSRGDPNYNPVADLDGNDCVDLADLAALLGVYGTTCP